MNRIRMAALGAAVVLGFGAQAQAQQTQPRQQQPRRDRAQRGAEGRDRAAGRLFRGIELTDAQKTSVKSVAEKYRGQRRALFPQAQGAQQRPDSAARAQRRAQFQQLAQREQSEIRALLTPAQQTQFDKNVAELRDRAGRRGERGARGARAVRGQRGARGPKGARAANRGERRPGAGAAFRGIQLTDAQKTQLATLRTKQRDERQAQVKQLRADGQRPDSADRARVRQLAAKQRTEVRALLTPAQQQQFDTNAAELKQRHEARGKHRGRARRS